MFQFIKHYFSKAPNQLTIRLVFLTIFLIELLSLGAYLHPILNKIIFATLLIIVLALTWQKLAYGLYFVIAELILGSKGYLFYWEFDEQSISIRMGFFAVVMGIYVAKLLNCQIIKRCFLIKQRFNNLTTRQFYKPYLFLSATIVYGIILGFLKGNNLTNIFLDANNWFYFLLILPMIDAFARHDNSKHYKSRLYTVITAALIALITKTFVILFIFSHKMVAIMPLLYRWIRITGVGEITDMDNFYRVFFQSHIFALLGFFVLLPIIISHDNKNAKKGVKCLFFQKRHLTPFFAATIIISFSRSFWVAAATTSTIYLLYLLVNKKITIALKTTMAIVVIFVVGLSLIFATLKFPYPQPADISLADALEERGSADKNEAAIGSRWNLLPILWTEIKKTPIFGAGLGKTVTYQTKDPRALEQNPDGRYTTYAFEWGYLDLWLKFGIFGLLSYGYLLWLIFKKYYLVYSQTKNPLLLGAVLSLICLMIVHFFTPYFNHPLGIGYILLLSILP